MWLVKNVIDLCVVLVTMSPLADKKKLNKFQMFKINYVLSR